MFKSIWDDIKKEYSYGNMVTRLVIINVAVYVTINLIWVILRLTHAYQTPQIYDDILHFFSISSNWLYLLTHPWGIVTSMFLHEGFFHILFNMLFLYWFGRIVGDFLGDHRILPLYLMAGLFGNAIFFISANLLPYVGPAGAFALGASGAVMGIVVAAAAIAPDYEMRLLFLGNVKLKFIAFALVLIDVVGVAGDINTGGHFAHLGGAAFGWFFVRRLQNGDDLSVPVNRFLQRIRDFWSGLRQERRGSSSRRGPRVAYRNPNKGQSRSSSQRQKREGKGKGDGNSLSHQEQLDAILDKIKDHGYESLSQDEKEFLFNASKKD